MNEQEQMQTPQPETPAAPQPAVKKPMQVGLILQAILCFVGIEVTTGNLVKGSFNLPLDIVTIFLYLVVIFYALYGYKIPHGNMFRIAMLVFAYMLLMTHAEGVMKYALFFCAVIVAYMSGRLHKYEECCAIIIGVLTILVVGSVQLFVNNLDNATSWYYTLAAFNPVILWGTFSLAYVVRYQLHREAGAGW